MKKDKNKIVYIIGAILIIIGAIICFTKGFNIELQYLNRQEMMINTKVEIDISKIEEISKSVLENQKTKVQRIDRFKNSVEIISTQITDEQKEQIINKINEQCNLSISNEDTKLVTIPNTRIRDVIKPYILPGIITFVVVLLYLIFMYQKLGINKVLSKAIFAPVMAQLTYYSIILITRIPFGRITTAISIGLYVISVFAVATSFEKEKSKISEKDENEK